ncbi:MAG: type II secretion system protein, partial [Chthoniobacterales bacterium]
MRKNQSGFTLLEIMLVVTIIALLLGTAIYKLSGNVEYARH